MSFICSTYLILGFITLLSSLIVVSALNPVHRIALLIVVFMAGSFMYTLLDYYFLGLTYIIVYVGAIAILFLFVIMMVQIEPRIYNDSNSSNIQATHLIYNSLSTSLLINDNILNDINNININTPSNSIDFYNTSLPTYFRSNNYGFNYYTIFIIIILSIFSLYISYDTLMNFNYIFTPYYANWAIDYKIMTDIQTLANVIYIAYPLSLVLIGVALWAVMIGVIGITGNDVNV